MLAHITVVTYNRLDLTSVCLSSLLTRTQGDYVVHVVDNGSEDGTQRYLAGLAEADGRVRPHFLSRNMGVAVAANYGWAQGDAARAPCYVKLDNDMEILHPDWLLALRHGADNGLGMVGYQFFAKHKTTAATLPDGTPFRASQSCGGGCVLVPSSTHAQLGFWCEDYGRYGFEDVDYSNRALLAGLTLGYLDHDGAVVHLGLPETADPGYTASKRQNIESDELGQKIFYLNKLLFEEKIRSLYVERRYRPQDSPRGVAFSVNPAYKALIKLQQRLLKSVSYSLEGDSAALVLQEWKAGREEN